MSIWFDVTTVVHWNRPPVGVVRVEAECFRYLASLSLPSVRFCHFHKRTSVYLEIGASQVSDLMARAAAEAPSAPAAPRSSGAERAAERARGALQRLPSGARAPLRELARKATPLLRTALHHYRRASTAVGGLADQLGELAEPLLSESAPVPTAGPARFQSGDVFVSAGLDWDEQDQVALYRLKHQLGIRVVLFCYDLIPVLFPHLSSAEVAAVFARYMVDVAWCADEVLCISRSTQRDFLAFVRQTGAPEPKTRVLRLGSALPGSGGASELVRGTYLLYVSTIERRKNHEVLYRAMVQLLERGRTDLPTIVFAGMQGWGVADFMRDLKTDPRVRGRFKVLNHVTDVQLSQLYAGAAFTLYPSLYEGWGLPLAESLAHGKFSLVSGTSSLPEVAGTLVEYLDPWAPGQWADRIAHYLDHPAELAAREHAIRASYRPQLWADTGRLVLEVAQEHSRSPEHR